MSGREREVHSLRECMILFLLMLLQKSNHNADEKNEWALSRIRTAKRKMGLYMIWRTAESRTEHKAKKKGKKRKNTQG